MPEWVRVPFLTWLEVIADAVTVAQAEDAGNDGAGFDGRAYRNRVVSQVRASSAEGGLAEVAVMGCAKVCDGLLKQVENLNAGRAGRLVLHGARAAWYAAVAKNGWVTEI